MKGRRLGRRRVGRRGLGQAASSSAGSSGDPSLAMWVDFAGRKTLAPLVGPTLTFTRASDNAKYIDSAGVLQTVSANNEPRFTHTPAGVSLGLMREEARENICLQSEDLATTWTLPGANTTVTDGATAPDGNATADDVKHLDSAETVQQTITVTTNTVVAISAYVKQGTTGSHDWVKMSWMDNSDATNGFEAWFDLSTGNVGSTPAATGTGSYTAGSARMTDAGSGWFRISAAGQIVTGQTDGRFELINTTADNGETAEATNSVFWWGMQVEEGAAPSSYIATTTGSVTRAAESIVTTDKTWFNAAAGTWYAKARKQNVSALDGYIFEMGGTGEDRHFFRNASATNPTYSITDNNISTAEIDGGTIADDTSFKMAGAYAVNDVALSVDGGAVVTDTSVALPALSDIDQLEIGFGSGGNVSWNDPVAALKYWNVRKADGFLQAITA